MADSIFKQHKVQLGIEAGLQLNDVQLRAFTANIRKISAQLQGSLDDAIREGISKDIIKDSMKDVVKQFNDQFRELGIKTIEIDIDKIDIDDKPFKLIATQASQNFAEAFKLGLKGSGIGDALSAEIVDSIDIVGGAVDKIFQRIEQRVGASAKKSVDDIKQSIKELDKLPKQNEVKKAVAVDKIESTLAESEKTKPTSSKTATVIASVVNAQKAYEKSITDNNPWVVQYKYLLDFVSKYDRLNNNTREKIEKEIPDIRKMYENLSPMSGAVKETLQDYVVTIKGKGELSQYKNQPWARESTLKDVADILKGGIQVKDSDGGGKNDEPPKPVTVQSDDANQGKKQNVKTAPTKSADAGAKTVKKETSVTSDTSAFNQQLFDAIEKLSNNIGAVHKSMTNGDINEDQAEDLLAELRSEFLKQFKFGKKQNIDDYLAIKSDNMGEWNSKKIYDKLSKQLKADDPSWPKVEKPIADIQAETTAHQDNTESIARENEELKENINLKKQAADISKPLLPNEDDSGSSAGGIDEKVVGALKAALGNVNLKSDELAGFVEKAGEKIAQEQTLSAIRDALKNSDDAQPNQPEPKSKEPIKEDGVTKLAEAIKQALANDNKSSSANEKAPWAKDETLRNLTNKKIENVVKNTQKIKIDKDGLATNDMLNRVAQATESINTRVKLTQTPTLDPTNIISPIIVVIQNVCEALSKAESAVDEFGNKVNLLTKQNLIAASQQQNNKKPSSNPQTGNVGNNSNLYSTKTLYVENAGKMKVAKVLEVEKGKTSNAVVTTSTLKDNKRQVLQQVVEKSFGKFEAEKAKEEAKAIKELLKLYERLGELRAKRDLLPKGTERDALQKEIKLETSRLWKQSKKLGVDSTKTNEASALGMHNVQMDQLIAKTKELRQYEKDVISTQRGSEVYNNAEKRIQELNSEIALIKKKIVLTQEERLELDALVQQNDEATNRKSAVQADKELVKIANELTTKYKELGELRAKIDNTPSGEYLNSLKEELAVKEKIVAKDIERLGLTGREVDDYNSVATDAYNAQKSKLDRDAAKARDEARRKAAADLLKADEKETDRELGQYDKEYEKSLDELGRKYVELGELRAKLYNTPSGEESDRIAQQIRQTEELIEKEKELLGLTRQEVSVLEDKATNSYNDAVSRAEDEAARKRDEARRKAQADAFKQADKDAKAQATEDKRQAKRNAMFGKAGNAIGRAENLWMNAQGEDEPLPPTLSKQIDELYDKMVALRAEQDKVRTAEYVTDEQQTDLRNHTIEMNALTNEVSELFAEYQKLSGKNVEQIGVNSLNKDAGLDAYKAQLQQAILAKYPNAQIKGFDAATKTLTYTLKTGAHEFTEYTAAVRRADGALVAVQGTTKRTETFFEATARKMKELTSYFSGMAIFNRVGQELRRGIQYVREIDLALTELKKVTNETEETYDKFLDTAAKTGARLGTTISAVTEATATFSKLGYSMEQATEMAEAAIVYKNVGDNIASTEDAADSIISTMKGFRLEASESMAIVDRFNEVGNRFAITSQGIGEALRLSASALSEGGNSLDESIALITAANEVVNDPSSVGTALKTLTLRLRGSKTELEEMGEDVSNMATTTSQLQAKLLALTGGQVDIMLDENTFKNSTQILREMAEAWEDMTDIQRASALELMGGKRQANVLSALIQNFDTVEEAIETSSNSAGSALKENERYLDSIQGKIDQFNNAMQSMWSNTLDSDWVKGFVAIGTEIIKIIDNIGVLRLAVAGFITYVAQKWGGLNFAEMFSGLTSKGVNFLFGKSVNKDIQSTTSQLEELEQRVKSAKQAYVDDGGSKSSAKALQEAEEGLATYKKLQEEGFKPTDQSKGYFGTEIQKIKDYKKVLKETEAAATQAQQNLSRAQASLDNYTGTDSKQLYKYQDGLKRAQANVDALSKKQTELKKNGSGAFTSLANGAAKFAKQIQSAIASMLVMYAISKVMQIIGDWWDKTHETAEEAKESFEELKSELSHTESELKTLDSQLEDIKSQIKEINDNTPLTFTDEEELSRLQAQSTELQRQIDLLHTIQKQQQYEVNESAINAAGKYAQTGVKTGKTTSENIGSKAGTGAAVGAGVGVVSGVGGAILSAAGAGTALGAWAGPLGMLIGAAIGAIAGGVIGAAVGGIESASEEKVGESLDNMREQYAKLQEEFDTARTNYQNDASDENKKKFEEAQEAFRSYQSNMASYMSEMDSYYSQIKANWDNATTEQKQEYIEWADKMDTWAIQSGGTNAKSNALDRIFGENAEGGFAQARDEIDTIKEKLKKAQETGDELAITKALSELETFELKGILSDAEIERLHNMGIYLYEAENRFKDVVKTESKFIDNDLEGVAKDIAAITDELGTLKSAFEEVVDKGYITSKTLLNLKEELGITDSSVQEVTDAWREYLDVMMSGYATTEQMTQATEQLAQAWIEEKLASNSLNPDTKNEYVAQLRDLGIANADQYVDSLLQKKMIADIADNLNIDAYLDGRFRSHDEAVKYVEEIVEKYGVEKEAIDDVIEKLKEKQKFEAKMSELQRRQNEYKTWYYGDDQTGELGFAALKEELDTLQLNDTYQTALKIKEVMEDPNLYNDAFPDGTYEDNGFFGGIYYHFNGETYETYSEWEDAVYKYLAEYEAKLQEFQAQFNAIAEQGVSQGWVIKNNDGTYSLKENVDDEFRAAYEAAEQGVNKIQKVLDEESLAPEVKLKLQLQEVDTAIDKIQSVYSSLKDITTEYNSQGYLSLDNLQAFLNLQPEYMACLQMENGQLTINQQALEAMLRTKLAEAEATAVQTAITQLNALAERKQAIEISNSGVAASQAKIELGEYSGTLSAVANDAIVAAGSVAAFNAALSGAQGNTLVNDEEWQQVLTNYNNTIGLINSAKDNLPTNFNQILDPGSSTPEEDVLQSKYERQIKNLENQQTYLENEIAILEAKDEPVSRSYYDKQIDIEEEKLGLYKLEREELLKLNRTDEVAERLWEVEHAIQESTLRMVEFRQSIIDLYKTAFDDIVDAYGNKEDLLSDRQSYIDKYRELMELQGGVPTASMYESQIETETMKQSDNLRKLHDLRAALQTAMRNGLEEGSEEWIDMQAEIRATEAAILDNKIAIEQYKEELKQLSVEAFNLMRNAFSNKDNFLTNQQDYVQGYIDLLEAQSIDVPAELYDKLIAIEKDKRANLVEDLTNEQYGARKMLADIEAKGFTAADEEWQDAYGKVVELEKAIQDCDIATAQWEKAIRDLDFEKFERFTNRLDDIASEIDHVRNLLSDDDVASEDGSWTEEGITSLGLLYQQMQLSEQQSQKYAKKIQDLTDAYKRGEMSEQEYYERLQELKEGQWDAIEAYEDSRDAIVDMEEARIDMIEEGINKEIEAYQELIDLKKEELDAERD